MKSSDLLHAGDRYLDQFGELEPPPSAILVRRLVALVRYREAEYAVLWDSHNRDGGLADRLARRDAALAALREVGVEP